MSENGNVALITPALTPDEAQFIINLLNSFPHQGNREQLTPVLVRSEAIVQKLLAAAEEAQEADQAS